jgi:hypothetical protein
VTFGDIQSWRAERAKTEPDHAATISDVYIRVTLKGQGYVETYGPITIQMSAQGASGLAHTDASTYPLSCRRTRSNDARLPRSSTHARESLDRAASLSRSMPGAVRARGRGSPRSTGSGLDGADVVDGQSPTHR